MRHSDANDSYNGKKAYGEINSFEFRVMIECEHHMWVTYWPIRVTENMNSCSFTDPSTYTEREGSAVVKNIIYVWIKKNSTQT